MMVVIIIRELEEAPAGITTMENTAGASAACRWWLYLVSPRKLVFIFFHNNILILILSSDLQST